MDDATVDRVLRLYTEQLELLMIDEEQITRWKKEKLTRQQELALPALSEQLEKTRKLVSVF